MRSMRFPVDVVRYSYPMDQNGDANLGSFYSSALPNEAPDGLYVEVYHHRADIDMVTNAVSWCLWLCTGIENTTLVDAFSDSTAENTLQVLRFGEV
jgi:hypothetical protein